MTAAFSGSDEALPAPIHLPVSHGEFAKRFGQAIEHERSRRGWTGDTAAKRAGLARKTWQRLEDGKPVRNESYLKLDRAFGLEPGTSLRCWQDQVSLSDELDASEPGVNLPVPCAIDSLIWAVRSASVADLRRLRDVVDTALAIRTETE